MVCRQASSIGHAVPAADYLTWTVANDNRPPSDFREWMVTGFGICSCFALQIAWSTFLISQLHS
jgi:hypothetical protein